MSPQDAELRQLLQEQFVPVRIVNFKGVDMNRFRFDYDLTFAVLMMNWEGNVYSRFGTQNAQHSSDLMSIAGLKKAMKDVLELHAATPQPKESTVSPAIRKTPADFPAFKRLRTASDACYHCHYANNARFEQARLDGAFTKEMLFQYPHPENIGLELQTDANNAVRRVLPGSPAEMAGVRAGDTLLKANGSRVITGADLQFVLNDLPDPGSVTLEVSRDSKTLPPLNLALPLGWRKTDVSWRPSTEGSGPMMGFWGTPLKADQKQKLGIPADRLAIQANFMFPGAHGAKTRGELKNGDIVVSVNGEALPDMTTRQFHNHFRMTFDYGQTVRVGVLRAGQKVEFEVPCLKAPRE